jgi:hypothetical protein
MSRGHYCESLNGLDSLTLHKQLDILLSGYDVNTDSVAGRVPPGRNHEKQ